MAKTKPEKSKPAAKPAKTKAATSLHPTASPAAVGNAPAIDIGIGTGDRKKIAEGLARKCVNGVVPEVLKDCTIFALDMGALSAGPR